MIKHVDLERGVKMHLTVEEVSVRLGLDKATAYGFVRACEAFGVCEKQEEVKRAEGKRGKGASIYAFSDNVGDVLSEKLRALTVK